jgi:hypothetical protein
VTGQNKPANDQISKKKLMMPGADADADAGAKAAES